ncbi:Rv3235 family protein [Streptosporangium sp. NPDC004379]|uniref:Rv3235 family protein n=1 Tax=Streptosporangium sp. NPDC004379 TaxID=3366189 RepID=UPI00368BC802
MPLPRLAPHPSAEPPYDDEHPPPPGPPYVQGALALAGEPEPAGVPEPEPTRARETGPARTREPGPVRVREPRPAGRGDRLPPVWGEPGPVPDGRRLRALGQAVAEALSGRRPTASLSAHMTVRAHAELVRAGKVIGGARPPLVGTPHVSQPEDGVVEMCVLVHCGDRPRVLALRLERRGARWLCTDVETTP